MAKNIQVNHCIRCGNAVEWRAKYGQERPVCPSCGWVHFADPKVAAGVFVEKEGKVLLVRRIHDPYRGLWTFPAGFVNAGEDPAQAASRECMEETGLNVRVLRLLDIHAKREHPHGADFIILYQAELIDGQLLAADDVDAAKWFSREALPSLAFEATRYFFKNF